MDEQIRRLERAAAGGDPEALVRLLREQLRFRQTDEWSALVEHLRRPPAPEAGEPYDPSRRLEDWLHDLGWRWGHDASLRAAIAIAGEVLETWVDDFATDPRPAQAIAAAEALVLAPSVDALAAARLAWQNAVAAAEPLLCEDATDCRAAACMAAAMGWAPAAPPDRKDHARIAGHFALRSRFSSYDPFLELWLAVQRDLLPWALREGDPIAARSLREPGG